MASWLAAARTALHRLPLGLHRLGLGGWERRLLGIDWIVVTTRGRRSGAPRTVVLDAIGHDPDTDTWWVQPADPARAHWLRNLRAHPVVEVEARGRRFAADAVEVGGDAAARVVLRFLRAHPWYGRLVVWLVGYVDRIDRPDAELLRALRDVVVVALRPSARAGQAEHPLG